MKFKSLRFLMAIVLVFGLASCATTEKESTADVDQGSSAPASSEESTHAASAEPAEESLSDDDPSWQEVGLEEAVGIDASGDIVFSSSPAARGNKISVTAGNTVVIKLKANGASSMSAEGLNAYMDFSNSRSWGTFSWRTDEIDAGTTAVVTFSADTGASVRVTIEVLGSK